LSAEELISRSSLSSQVNDASARHNLPGQAGDTLARLSAETDPSGSCRLGVLAFGDSITNGGGERQWGIAPQSWALWVARALGIPFTSFADDGALVADVVRDQIPSFERRTRQPEARYDLGCLYIGVNDVLGLEWRVDTYELDFRRALEFLDERCDLLLTMTAPLDLGRPRAGDRVRELNSAIERVARELGAVLVELRPFHGRNLVTSDHVHPTALGQIAIADRAVAALQHRGVPVTVRPCALISFETNRWTRLRADLTYLYRHGKVSAREVALLAVVRTSALLKATR
jgi:lysophospholipase L1-like esterase